MQLLRPHLRILHLAFQQECILHPARRHRLPHLVPEPRAHSLLLDGFLPYELSAGDEVVAAAGGDDARWWGRFGCIVHWLARIGARGTREGMEGLVGADLRRWYGLGHREFRRQGICLRARWRESLRFCIMVSDDFVSGLDG
ncbi:hypothetical protein FIBSPDRAFT_373006 [Athelia psychrophila]|uniref:Uncharacterized protein n=1 Tax=Athelia psychrophila TaxID=1759441 RepID=A0A166VVY3_9AGAM|nr:hypothetical protein FIBSPDRAFT_373006 [Fibularhizoctonia sp. CBS 109695]